MSTPEVNNDYAKHINLVPEDTRTLAQLLEGAFMWSSTHEGDDYWREVFEKLSKLGTLRREDRNV